MIARNYLGQILVSGGSSSSSPSSGGNTTSVTIDSTSDGVAEILSDQGSPADVPDAWPIRVTDGSSVAAIKANGQAATAADPALVVTLSPNNPVVLGGAVTAAQGSPPWSENIVQVGGAALSLGQKAMAASIPVVLPSDQAAIPVTGTVTADVTDRASRLLGHVTVDAVPGAVPLEVALQPDAEAIADQGTPADLPDAWPVRITDGNAVPAVKLGGQIATSADSALVVALAPGAVVSGIATVQSGPTNLAQVNGRPISLANDGYSLPVMEDDGGPAIDILRLMLIELRSIRAGIAYMATEGGRVRPEDLDPDTRDFLQERGN